MPKINKTKKVIRAWMIKNRTAESPWTMQFYPTEQSAWEGFGFKNGLFNFDREMFEVIPVEIHYTLPSPQK